MNPGWGGNGVETDLLNPILENSLGLGGGGGGMHICVHVCVNVAHTFSAERV